MDAFSGGLDGEARANSGQQWWRVPRRCCTGQEGLKVGCLWPRPAQCVDDDTDDGQHRRRHVYAVRAAVVVELRHRYLAVWIGDIVGRIMFELSYPDKVVAREALERAIQKLPIKARFVMREEAF